MALPRAALLISAVDPNDPAATDTWTDFARTRMLRVKNAARGRQYELAQSVAGRMDADLLNIDEYLNPANASSPLLSTAKLMRRTRLMMVLPADGGGNLVNLNNIKGDPSFESGLVGLGAFPLFWGNMPVVTTTNPHSGTRAMAQSINNTGALQGWAVELRLIPGDVYTMSVWMHQTSANTMQWGTNTPDWNHGAILASTSTAGAYVKLIGTFTASQPSMMITLTTSGATLSGTLTCDEIQVEQGASATAFTTTGPRIRGVWGGHVEKLPITWETGSNGYTGTAKLSAVGPLAAIAQIGVKTDYSSAMAAQKPDYWWPLWDGSSATSFAEISGSNGPPLVQLSSKYGANVGQSPPQAGASIAIAGEPGGSGVRFMADTISSGNDAGGHTNIWQKGYVLSAGHSGSWRVKAFPSTPSSPWAVSASMWVQVDGTLPLHDYQRTFVIAGNAQIWDQAATVTRSNTPIAFTILPTAGELELKCQIVTAGTVGSYFAKSAAGAITGGKWHHIAGVVSQDNTNTVLTLYIDGVQVATSTTATSTTGVLNEACSIFQVGGMFLPMTVSYTFGGTIAQIGVWGRALSSGEVTNQWNAGRGYPGDTPGQRLNRLFGMYYVGPTVVDTGRTLLGPSGAVDGTKLGQIAQRIVDSEAGNLAENRDAALEFDGRDSRFLATVPQAVFGENVAGGEIPYRDTPIFGYDTAQLNNQATVTQTGGTKANASDPASIKSYYQRSIQVNTDAQSGLVAIDHANWLVATRSQPKQRVERITLDPGANPSIQAAVLDLELNQRYTLKRNAKAGNGGAGLAMSSDYFLENINHRDFDPEKGTWLVDLILSPAPLQPWILGDSTWGQLGTTTILGF